MSTLYPGALDSFTNPISSNPLNSPSHSGEHTNANDSIAALESKVGVDGSAVVTSLDYKVGQRQIKLACVGKTANYTANPFELVNCDVSAGSFKVTLPSAPADGTVIYVKLNGIGANKYLTIATSGTDKFNTPTGTVEIYMYLFGEYAQMQYCSSTGIWTTFISAATYNFATNFPGIDATTPITNSNITVDATARTLTIVPPLGYFNIFVDGGGVITRFRKVGNVSFPAFADTSGFWYFYFNSAGTAVTTQTPWTVTDFPSSATVYRLLWNANLFNFTVTAATAAIGDTYTNNSSTFTVLEAISGGTTLKCARTTGTNNPSASGNLVRATGAGTNPIVFSAFTESPKIAAQYIEYHLNTISADEHKHMHLGGAIWGGGTGNFDIKSTATAGTPAVSGVNTCISLTSGTNIDDNLPYTITNDTSGNLWTQDLGNTTPASITFSNSGQFKIFTQNAAGDVLFLPATRFPFAWDAATNRPQTISQTGVRTLVPDNRWFVYFVYATQNPVAGEAIKIVSAPAEFTSLANAQAYNWSDIQALYPSIIGSDNELRVMYRCIFYNDNSGGGSFDSAVKYSALREVQDLRKTVISNVASVGGSLPASSVTVVQSGSLGTNAQSSLENLDSGKANLAGGNSFTGNQTFDTNTLFVDTVNHMVGVGTLTPASLLNTSFNQSNQTTSALTLDNIAAGGWGLGMQFRAKKTDSGTMVSFAKIVGEANGTWANDANSAGSLVFFTASAAASLTERMRILPAGNVGIGTTSPTAVLHLKAGTATASTAPLKLTSGVSLTAPEAGALEFTTDTLSFTITTGAARKTIAFTDSNIDNGTSGTVKTGTIELGHATDTTLSRVSAGVIAVEGVTVPTISSTSTLTNKRINPRLVTTASYTTDTGTSLDVSTCDQFEITAQAGALKFNNPSGTPLGGQKLIVRIKDNGNARALTYDTQFRALGNALPSTTVLSKTLYLGFIYNATDTKWDLVATAQEA